MFCFRMRIHENHNHFWEVFFFRADSSTKTKWFQNWHCVSTIPYILIWNCFFDWKIFSHFWIICTILAEIIWFSSSSLFCVLIILGHNIVYFRHLFYLFFLLHYVQMTLNSFLQKLAPCSVAFDTLNLI